MTKARILATVLFAAASISSPSSHATSELHKNVEIGLVGEIIIGGSNPNADYIFEILGTDTAAMSAILDVFSYPDGAFIGEGIPHNDPGIGDFAARVDVPVGAHNGKMFVIVRPMGDLQANVTLRITRTMTEPPYAVGSADFAMSFSGTGPGGSVRIPIPNGLVANTQIHTVEEAATSAREASKSDTILMVLEDHLPIAFDDDRGVGRMSSLKLSKPCRGQPAHTCEIFVAARGNDKRKQSPDQPGYEVPLPVVGGFHVTLVWDEDVNNGKDREKDGLGNVVGDGLGEALETFIGTCPDPAARVLDRDGDGIPDCDDPDVDGDGLSDGVEVLGLKDPDNDQETKNSLVRMPYYGADPLKPDVFFELDWITDNRRFTQLQEMELVSYMPSEISVHIDGGHPDPSFGNVTGDWGGAEGTLDPDGPFNACTGFSPTRAGLFSHLLSVATPQNHARCSFVSNGSVNGSAHELGHYFGLTHWGDPADEPLRNVNCKYNYLSIMNYNLTYEAGPPGSGKPFGPGPDQLPPFSHAAFSGLMLNDYAVNELAGLGASSSPTALNVFKQYFGYMVDTTNGYVDWNRNGKYDAGITRGMLNTPLGNGGDCDQSAPSQRRAFDHAAYGLPSLSTDSGVLELAALAPVGTPVGGGASTTVGILLGVQPNLSACDTTQGKNSCASFPTTLGQFVVNPVPEPGLFAPAVVGGIVVYADSSGGLYFFDKPAAAGATVSPTRVGGPPISGDPIATVRPSGVVSVYAPSGGFLLRWDYDPGQATWTVIGDTQCWGVTTPCSPIATNVGIGLTWGYQMSFPGEPSFPNENLYAAVLTQNAGGTPVIALARLDGAESAVTLPGSSTPVYSFPSGWVELPASITGLSPGTGLAQLRLGLAFRPEDPAALAPKPGRFYLTYQVYFDASPPGLCYPIWPHRPMMNFTMGNLFSDTTSLDGKEQPFRFLNAVTQANAWTSFPDGVSIAYYNGGVRGAQQTMPRTDYNIKLDANGKPIPKPGGGCEYNTPIAVPTLTAPFFSFYPNIDGIFNLDQFDFNDVAWIQSHMAWALIR